MLRLVLQLLLSSEIPASEVGRLGGGSDREVDSIIPTHTSATRNKSKIINALGFSRFFGCLLDSYAKISNFG